MTRYTITDRRILLESLADSSMSLQEISKKLNRSTPSIEQKLTELAVEMINRGVSREEAIRLTRAKEADIDLLISIPDPKIEKIKELVGELYRLLKLK